MSATCASPLSVLRSDSLPSTTQDPKGVYALLIAGLRPHPRAGWAAILAMRRVFSAHTSWGTAGNDVVVVTLQFFGSSRTYVVLGRPHIVPRSWVHLAWAPVLLPADRLSGSRIRTTMD